MSVVLVCFPGAPQISEEAVKKEEELDKYLEARVEGEHDVPPVDRGHVCLRIFSVSTLKTPVLLSHTHTHTLQVVQILECVSVLQPVLS